MSQTNQINSNSLHNDDVSSSSNEILASIMKEFCDQSLIDQIKRLNERVLELQQIDAERAQAFYRQGVDLSRIKEENERLYRELKKYESEGNSFTPHSFVPSYDCRDFINEKDENPTMEWVVPFWGGLYELTNIEHKGTFLIKNATSIVPIYKVVTEGNVLPYRFCGTIADFAYRWNANVAQRIDEKSRGQKLTCVPGTLTAFLHKEPWKQASPSSWNRLSTMGGKYADVYSSASIVRNHIKNMHLKKL